MYQKAIVTFENSRKFRFSMYSLNEKFKNVQWESFVPLNQEVKGVFYHIHFGNYRSTHEHSLKNTTQETFPILFRIYLESWAGLSLQ